MPIPASINDLSTTASSNSPSGSESPGILDDIQRVHASFIATLRDQMALKADSASLIITKSYDSGDLTYVSADGQTLVHGLGVTPKIILVYMHCVSADNQYSAGDYALIPSGVYFDGTNSRGVQIFNADAATISFVTGSDSTAISLLGKTSRVVVGLTNTKWRIVIRAYA